MQIVPNHESKLTRLSKFVSRNRYELMAVGSYALITGSVYYLVYQTASAQNQRDVMATNYNRLREAVIAGHTFKYEVDTDSLWDLNIRPDKA